MALTYFTSSTLISDVKRRAMIPTNQKTFSDDDFLAFANEEMSIGIVPSILDVHQEYFVTTSDVTLIANQANYLIPYRAIGCKLRDIYYKDTNGNLREMSRVPEGDLAYYQSVTLENRFAYYYLRGNEVVLLPTVGANPTGTLLFVYYLRPNQLVSEDRVGTISSYTIDAGADTITFTVDQIPDGFETSTKSDVLQAKPGHKTVAFDVTPTTVNATNLTIMYTYSDFPSEYVFEVGDYIAFANESIIPQIPDEMHSILSQRVAARCIDALGDNQGLNRAMAKVKEMEQKTTALIDNRVEASPQKINNLRGLLRSSKSRNRGWI